MGVMGCWQCTYLSNNQGGSLLAAADFEAEQLGPILDCQWQSQLFSWQSLLLALCGPLRLLRRLLLLLLLQLLHLLSVCKGRKGGRSNGLQHSGVIKSNSAAAKKSKDPSSTGAVLNAQLQPKDIPLGHLAGSPGAVRPAANAAAQCWARGQ